MTTYDKYRLELVDRFWKYRESQFALHASVFDQCTRKGARPPVFKREFAYHNIVVDRGLTESQIARVRTALPETERHKWFGSMKSSQALVQSVFGNLSAMGQCEVLRPVMTEQGSHPFEFVSLGGENLALERHATQFKEPRPTSVDVDIDGEQRVAIECKFTETDVGRCSRPRKSKESPEYCDGSYRCQQGRLKRCALTSLGIRYWEFIPKLFTWSDTEDHDPCPIHNTYQLVRNVLAASVDQRGEITKGYAVLLYDGRNPKFTENGDADHAFRTVRSSLKDPYRMQRLSWQTLMKEIRKHADLKSLTDELLAKYGL